MKKVAITGGAGFIGSNLAESLIKKGFDVTIIDDLSTGLLANIDRKNCEFREFSINDATKLKKTLKDAETIFHLGARGSVPRSIKNPIASSSVYGRNMQLPKEEKMWLGPMTPYAASKLSAEGYVEAYGTSYEIPVTLLRFFNVLGPRQRPDHEYAAVIPKWIWLAIQGKPVDLYGDGTQSRDFTYVKTVVDIAVSAMEHKITTLGAVNLAYGNRIFLTEVVDLLRSEFPNLKVNSLPIRAGDVKESQNSPELIKSLFPSVTPYQFKEAVKETIDWLRVEGSTIANGPKVSD